MNGRWFGKRVVRRRHVNGHDPVVGSNFGLLHASMLVYVGNRQQYTIEVPLISDLLRLYTCESCEVLIAGYWLVTLLEAGSAGQLFPRVLRSELVLNSELPMVLLENPNFTKSANERSRAKTAGRRVGG